MHNLWCFVAFYNILLQNQFFCDLREASFGIIYALLRGEKLSQKLCPWRKNDKYEVCVLLMKICSVRQLENTEWREILKPGREQIQANFKTFCINLNLQKSACCGLTSCGQDSEW